MKLRPVQLVCLALLLATLRLADPAALAPDDFALRAGVLNVLLRAELVPEWKNDWVTSPPRPRTASRIPAPVQVARRQPQPLPAQAVTALEARWTMPPPASQSAGLQSFTSFLRG